MTPHQGEQKRFHPAPLEVAVGTSCSHERNTATTVTFCGRYLLWLPPRTHSPFFDNFTLTSLVYPTFSPCALDHISHVVQCVWRQWTEQHEVSFYFSGTTRGMSKNRAKTRERKSKNMERKKAQVLVTLSSFISTNLKPSLLAMACSNEWIDLTHSFIH